MEETACCLRGTHIGCQLSERVRDSSFARFDVTRNLELTNDPRSGSKQWSCLVAVRDDERTARRQPDRKGVVGSGKLLSRRFGCHQTFESALLETLRYRHHHRLLVVDTLDPCDGACSCLDVSRVTSRQVDIRLSVGRRCASLLDHRAVMRLVVDGRGCGCGSPACSSRVQRLVRVMVLLLSRRLSLVTTTVTACPSVGR